MLQAWSQQPGPVSILITYTPRTTIMPTLYRVTFRDLTGKEETLPVYSSSAVQAVADLGTLGYKLRKVTAVFPTV